MLLYVYTFQQSFTVLLRARTKSHTNLIGRRRCSRSQGRARTDLRSRCLQLRRQLRDPRLQGLPLCERLRFPGTCTGADLLDLRRTVAGSALGREGRDAGKARQGAERGFGGVGLLHKMP